MHYSESAPRKFQNNAPPPRTAKPSTYFVLAKDKDGKLVGESVTSTRPLSAFYEAAQGRSYEIAAVVPYTGVDPVTKIAQTMGIVTLDSDDRPGNYCPPALYEIKAALYAAYYAGIKEGQRQIANLYGAPQTDK